MDGIDRTGNTWAEIASTKLIAPQIGDMVLFNENGETTAAPINRWWEVEVSEP